jgi:hypothetical protein
MESEQQATNELMSQKTSAIDLRREAATTTTVLLRPEAVHSSAVISRPCRGIAERKRLTAEEGLQALDKNLCAGTVVAKTLKLNGKNR